MSDEIAKSENDLSSNRDKASEIARQAMDVEFLPVHMTKPETLHKAKKYPLGEIAALGTAFASMPEAVRTVTTVSEGIYKVVLPAGAEGLKTLKNGQIKGAFAKMQDGGSKLAELVPIADAPTTVPYDPTTLFMAMALAEINRKLDTIQETQQEMFEYMRQKDDAIRRGNLETLADVLNNYKFNWDNETYKTNKHNQVQGIRQNAGQDIIFLRSQIASRLEKNKLINLDGDAEGKLDDVLTMLKDYQVAVYLYSFSSFLEVMLLENFDGEYLESIIGRINKHSLDYRTVYTEAYNQLEQQTETTLQQHVLGGLSAAGRTLGSAIEKTPLGDVSPIDEAFIDAGKRFGQIKDGHRSSVLERLPEAKVADVRPFTESLSSVNTLYNQPSELLTDGETFYLLPSDEE